MNIDTLISEVKAKFDHNLAKHYLKEKYQSKLIFANQGGLWKADQSLLSLLVSGESTKFILLDLNENPIKVDRTALFQKALDIYYEVMEEWYQEWEELRTKR
jgi:hypothetical protein